MNTEQNKNIFSARTRAAKWAGAPLGAGGIGSHLRPVWYKSDTETIMRGGWLPGPVAMG